MKKRWLAEIRIKDWCAPLPDGSRVFDYEEVEALECETSMHNVFARYAAMDLVEKRIKYEPSYARRLLSLGLSASDLCSPDAILVD